MNATNNENPLSLSATTKAEYETPVVTTFGSVGKLTQGYGNGTHTDSKYSKNKKPYNN